MASHGLYVSRPVSEKFIDQKLVLQTGANQRSGLHRLVETRHRQRALEIGDRPTKEREAIEFRVSLAFEDDLSDGGVDNADR